MFKKIILSALAVLFLTGFSAIAQTTARPNAAKQGQQIKKITVTIPQKRDEAAQAIIVEKLLSLETRRFIYLDLSINFPARSNEGLPYSVSVNGKPPSDDTRECETGAQLMGGGVTYHMGPIANYNHLLLSVFTGDRSAFPYNDVSCEYLGLMILAFFMCADFFISSQILFQRRRPYSCVRLIRRLR